MKKLMYIAGPMTGLPDYNRAAFFAAARWIKDNTEFVPIHTAWMESGFEDRQYMAMSIHLLASCDAMVLLPGWRESKGVAMEIQEAIDRDIPVVKLEELENEKRQPN